jgi:hypothetical protein
MFIRIRKVGGIAGIDQEVAAVDTAKLPKSVADEIRQHLRFISALRASAVDRPGEDHFEYAIDIDGEPGTAALRVVEFCDPDEPMMKHVRAVLTLLAANRP